MKNLTLIKLLLGISFLLTIFLLGCQAGNINDIPTADISSVIGVLDDDTSGITWQNQATIKLNPEATLSGNGYSVDHSKIYITKGGSYTLTGTLSDGSIIINTEDPINLILNNASITNLSGPAVNIQSAQTAYITLTANTTNHLVDGANYDNATLTGTLFSNAPLIFQGNGSINISAQYKHGIASNNSITINNGAYTISSIENGIDTTSTFILNGGSIQINSITNGITSIDKMYLNDGVISIDKCANGLLSHNDINVKGCTINISDTTTGINSSSNIIIDDGNLNISANLVSLLSGYTTTINNGNIHLDASEHAICTKRSFIMNDGILLALTNAPELSSIDCADHFTITGGTLLATGSVTSLPDPIATTQYTVSLGSVSAEQILHIQKDDISVLTFLPSHDYHALIFSSPLLTNKGEYTVYSGGAVTGGTNFYGIYQDSAYAIGKKLCTFSCNQMLTSKIAY